MLSKRGDVSDGIVILITLFFIAVAFIAVAFINDKFKDVVADTALNESTAASSIVSGLDRITTSGIQNGFVLIFGFLVIGTLVSSFLVRVHPAFIFLYIIFAGFAVILAVVIANAYNTMINATALQSIAAQQGMMNWIMQHIVKIIIGVIGLSMIVLFAKFPDNQV